MPKRAETPAGVVRLLDASLNRASEGARVVEDYARFVLDDLHLTGLAKALRHDLASAGALLPSVDLLAARDTQGDVGTVITTANESDRTGAWEVCGASLGRLQEALRSLEEYSKTIDPAHGSAFEQLRYRTYTLAKAFGATERGRDRLGEARLYVLIDGRDSADAFAAMVESLADAGADVLQLRDKRLDDRTLVERGRQLADLCRECGGVSIINDRPDIALAAGADGVHVGQEELSVADVRVVVGTQRLIGVSTHSIEQARAAVLDGADYLGVGPTFPSQTKSFDDFPGLDFVREVAEEITLPAFAIGGIGEASVGSVIDAGLGRVAVSRAVVDADDPAAVVRRLKDALAGVVGGATSSG
ncbi:MAG: thiamine phosphate synthase [Planctomycetota bacterium]